MKAYVIGTFELEGKSKKTGNDFSIGKLYCALPMSGKGTRGMQGSEYDVEAAVARKLDGISLPVLCELEMQDVMRYGKREQQVVSVTVIPNDPQSVRAPGTAVKPA